MKSDAPPPRAALSLGSLIRAKAEKGVKRICEDAVVADFQDGTSDGQWTVRLACADGVSNSFRSHRLSTMLVQCWRLCDSPADFNVLVRSLMKVLRPQLRARDADHWTVKKRALEVGSAATFVGAIIRRNGETASFEATGLGDSVLLHVTHEAVCSFTPYRTVDDFPHRPDAYTTLGEFVCTARPWKVRGELRAGEALYLMTDELARWAVRENPRELIGRLRTLTQVSADAFDEVIRRMVRDGEMAEDDVALAWLRNGEPQTPKENPPDDGTWQNSRGD